MSRRSHLVLAAVITLFPSLAAPAAAQGRLPGPRLTATAWAGYFVTKNAGFSSDENTFNRFDRAPAIGGALHYRVMNTIALGVDVLYSSADYKSFNRSPPEELGGGSSTSLATMLTVRLEGSPGGLSIYLTGGAGFYFIDAPDLGDVDRDNALMGGAGIEYRTVPNLAIFAEIAEWWVFHDKVDNVVNNRLTRALLRGGVRLRIF